jgi:two-component system NtrC family response regulator
LVESELFGHERGAFTGAIARRAGAFREASPGTLLLDEVGELPPAQQAKLLRVLETSRVRPVGGTDEQAVEVRIVAATHRDLGRDAHEGRFRLDLYHRLAGVVVDVPPLRRRPGDALLLAHHFLAEAAGDGSGRAFDPTALALLERHDWPGNVRELRNTVLRGVALGGPTISASDLRPGGQLPPGPPPAAAVGDPLAQSGSGALTPELGFIEIERRLLVDALERAGGSARRAAHILGLPRSTFYDRARRYGLL